MREALFEHFCELEQLRTEELAAMLREETEKDLPNDELVIGILRILEERSKENRKPLTVTQRRAWEDFQAKVKKRNRRGYSRRGILRAAILALAIGFALVSIPMRSQAGSFWKILSSWTDDIFQYVNTGSKGAEPEEYVFQTENPGLQQVYDAVVSELGVTEPVVPMWLPGEMELVELEVFHTDAQDGIYVRFGDGDKYVVMTYYLMEQDQSPAYDKIAINPGDYEFNGITHSILRNNNTATVSWVKHNLKCSIHIDCQEDEIKEIIKSIY